MLSRDFISGFINGQVRSGLTESEAKKNFTTWLIGQDESIIPNSEKDLIISDLGGYSVKE